MVLTEYVMMFPIAIAHRMQSQVFYSSVARRHAYEV